MSVYAPSIKELLMTRFNIVARLVFLVIFQPSNRKNNRNMKRWKSDFLATRIYFMNAVKT